ncbi:MAG TPA: hypothetical protein VME43_23935 [Bryobacteraceae bacterium]|nr:hypothetical protein [Bryobacteraceae bacterium]
MGASTIMIIRHAEKPDSYNGQTYNGVNALATGCGKKGSEDLVTLGWERTGGLVTLFAPPWGPKPSLATPQTLFASNPTAKDATGAADAETSADKSKEPSQRPYETLTAVAAALGSASKPMAIDTSFSKKHYDQMVTAALACEGAVLVAWQHENIPAIGQEILKQTGTPASVKIPTSWSGKRYDLVWVFNRPSGSGAIVSFVPLAQMLLAGDGPAPPID